MTELELEQLQSIIIEQNEIELRTKQLIDELYSLRNRSEALRNESIQLIGKSKHVDVEFDLSDPDRPQVMAATRFRDEKGNVV